MSVLFVIEALLELLIQCMIGVYFIFSNTVVKALSPLDSGADTMVRINRVILNPGFMLLFWGSALASVYFAVLNSGLMQLAGVTFFTGTFVVTLLGNVPLNQRLDALHGSPSALSALWKRYRREWTLLNHIRTVSSFVAGALLNLA